MVHTFHHLMNVIYYYHKYIIVYLLLDEKLVHFSTRTQRHLDHKLTVKNP